MVVEAVSKLVCCGTEGVTKNCQAGWGEESRKVLACFVTDRIYSIAVLPIVSCDSSSLKLKVNETVPGGGVVSTTAIETGSWQPDGVWSKLMSYSTKQDQLSVLGLSIKSITTERKIRKGESEGGKINV